MSRAQTRWMLLLVPITMVLTMVAMVIVVLSASGM